MRFGQREEACHGAGQFVLVWAVGWLPTRNTEKLDLVAMLFSGLDSKLRRANWEMGAQEAGKGGGRGRSCVHPVVLRAVLSRVSLRNFPHASP